MKLTLILFFARFIARYLSELREQLWGALKPLGFLLVIGGLLLMEPDYGALGVMLVVALGMLFLCGVRLWQFLIFTLLVSAAMSWLIIQAPYRLTRLLSFIDPWDDPFSTDYQLSQALIAIGRGDWWGVGLGNGIQKLAYLPDAHTDFMFAILSEELGFAGAVSVIFLFVWVLVRIFTMANQAMALQKPFAAFLAYGIGMWISIQMFINIGVNLGLLPTKGLTLPWMSYGRSSLLVMCIVLGLLLRIDYENSQPKKRRYGARKGSG
jgi:cell division protein FtsW